jgi:hypothetical protein
MKSPRSSCSAGFILSQAALRLCGLTVSSCHLKQQAVRTGGHIHCLPIQDITGEQLFSQRILHILLDHPLQRARAISGIVALLRQPAEGAVVQIERNLAISQKTAQALKLDFDDIAAIWDRCSRWNRTISSSRLRNSGRKCPGPQTSPQCEPHRCPGLQAGSPGTPIRGSRS